jgi:hypothetical protein
MGGYPGPERQSREHSHVLDTLGHDRYVGRRGTTTLLGPSLIRAALAAASLLLSSALAWSSLLSSQPAARAQTADVAVNGGRLPGATRYQLAWLDCVHLVPEQEDVMPLGRAADMRLQTAQTTFCGCQIANGRGVRLERMMVEADDRTREVLERYRGLHPVTFGHGGTQDCAFAVLPGPSASGAPSSCADPSTLTVSTSS